MCTNEERLFVGISPRGYLFQRMSEIIAGASSDKFGPVYYAALPLTDSQEWHTGCLYHKTFIPYGHRLVAFQTPTQLKGFPIVEIAEERYVECKYAEQLNEARLALHNNTLNHPAYTINVNKPLTYVFIYELPKFVLKYGKDGWMLKPTSDFGDVINELEENFCSEKETEQRYLNRAPLDPPECGIGAYHGDF